MNALATIPPAELGDRLRQTRESRCFTTIDAAWEIYRDVGRIEEIESGEIAPTATEIIRLCRYYGVPASSIVNASLKLAPRDAVDLCMAGQLTEGQLADHLGVDRLDA